MNVFLASSLFSEAEREYNSRIAELVRRNGHVVWLAQEAPFIQQGTLSEKRKIFDEDIRALVSSDSVVAVLDGSNVDPGVAFELGYAYCLGKPIVGLKTDYRTFSKIEEVNLMLEVPLVRLCGNVEELLSTLRHVEAKKS
jgi:nucleoside 2-deoxyribosyltransferase